MTQGRIRSMPLRDHFHSPVDDFTSWDGFHGLWPGTMIQALERRLPRRYVAMPHVHPGAGVEIDVGTFEEDESPTSLCEGGHANGGLATAVWAPSKPNLALATDLPEQDEYE